MAKELSDAEVMQPSELSDADVSAPVAPAEKPLPPGSAYLMGEQLRQTHERALAELKQPGPGFMAGFPALAKVAATDLIQAPGNAVSGFMDMFAKGRKAWYEGLTPQEEVEVAANAALMNIGSGEGFKGLKTKAPTPFEAFHEEVTKPVAEALAGLPNQDGRITVPLDPRNVAAEVKEAHDMGVVGGPKETVATDTPAEAAFRAMPPSPAPLGAAVTPDVMKGRLGHAPGEYDARGKEWIDKIDAPEDAKAAIEAMAKQYDFFPEARGGRASPAARAAVAEAAGIEPGEINDSYFSEHFDSDGKVRATVQFLRQATKDVTDAAEKMREDPSEENAAAQLIAQERHKNVLEYTLGLRAESGRTLAAWKDLLRETERSRAVPQIKAEEEAGKTPVGASDLVSAAHDVQSNLGKPKGPIGVDKLVRSAGDLVDKQDKLIETRKKLTDISKQARSGAEQGKTPAGLSGLISEAQELAKTLPEGPKTVGKPEPQGVASMLAEAKKAVGGPYGAPQLIRLAEQAEKLAMEMPRNAEEAAAKLPPDLAQLVGQARSVVNRFGKPGDTNLERTLSTVEQQTKDILKQKTGRPPKEALPPEIQALVDKANLVTKRFGGIAKGEEAALLLARSGRTAAEQAELARQVEGLTPNQIARVLQRLRTEKRPSWQFWTVTQGLISGLVTHTGYVAVNTAHMVFERVLAPELAALIGKARGQKTSLYAPLRSIPEMFNAVPDALAAAKQAFKTNSRIPLESELRLAERGEKSPQEAGAHVPYGTTQGPDWGRVGKWFPQGTRRAETIMGSPGRSVNSIHTIFGVLNERMAAGSRAFEKAELEGNKPGTEEFWNRYHYHLDNPTDDVLRANVDDAYSGKFMQALGKQSEAFSRLVKNTPLKWLIFFTHIPLNMARTGVEYSPLAFLNTIGETRMGQAIKGELGPDAQNLAFAKITIGTAIGGYFISRALAGQMTGDYPTNEKERRRWKVENIPPNSFQGGGLWWSIERMGPQAIPARIAANFADVIKNYDGSDNDAFMKAVWATVLGTGRAVASDTGFESIRSIIDIMENPKEAAKGAAYRLGSILQPISLISQAASFNDPYMREAETLIGALKSRLPFLRETLPAKRDPVYGEPVHNPGYHAIFRTSPIDTDPIKQELNRIGYYPTAPEKKIGGVKLTPEQYDRYEVTAGQFVKAALTNLMSSPQWKMHNNQPEWQKATAQAYVSEARARAEGAMQADSYVRDGKNNLVALGRQQWLAAHNMHGP